MRLLRPHRSPDDGRLLGAFELAALLLVGAAAAGVLISTAVASPRLTYGLRVIALLSLFVGGTLVAKASRRYFLGLGGVATCGFIAIMLATYSGLAINASSSVGDPGALQWHADRPAIFLSMLGFLSALLLVASPWSTRRAFVQPMLIVAGSALPAVALITLPKGGGADPANLTNIWIGRNDPTPLLGVIGLALLAPVQTAGAVGWVYVCMSGASRLKRILAAPKFEVAVLITWTAWLMLGVTGALPRNVGGGASFLQPLRHADARTWLIASALTLVAWVFASRAKGTLERAEGTVAATVGLAYLIGQTGLAFALAVLFLSAFLIFQAEPAVAVAAVALLTAALAIALPIAWFAGTKRGRPPLVAGGCVAVGILVAGAAVVWPIAANVVTRVGLLRSYGIGFLTVIVNSNIVIAATLLHSPLAAAAVAVGYVLLHRWYLDFRGPWKGTAEYGYALSIVPVCVWMLIGAGLLIPRTIAHPLRNAFAHWPLPDPSEVAVVACCITTLLAVVRWARRESPLLSNRHFIGATALSALAFIPFLVPSAFRSGGRLALAGVVVVLMAVLARIVAAEPFGEARRRQVSWQLGAAALSVPLLSYTAVAAAYSPALLGGTLADVGHNIGLGPLSHLRLLAIVPLTVGLLVADHDLPRPKGKPLRDSRWRDFEADALVQAVGEGFLPELLTPPLTRYLIDLRPDARRLVALHLARALAQRYRVRRSIPAAAQASRADLNAALVVAARSMTGDANELEIARARVTAERIGASARLVSGATRDVRTHLASALRIVLGADSSAVDELVRAMLVVVEATARPYLARQSSDDTARERALTRYRHALRVTIDAWPGRFTLFQDPTVFDLAIVAIAPSFVLDDERRRLGLIQPIKRPYAYVAAFIAFIAAVVLLVYLLVVIEFHVVRHIVPVH